MKTITLRLNDDDFEWLSEQHWTVRMSRSAYGAKLLSEAIASERAATEETSTE